MLKEIAANLLEIMLFYGGLTLAVHAVWAVYPPVGEFFLGTLLVGGAFLQASLRLGRKAKSAKGKKVNGG